MRRRRIRRIVLTLTVLLFVGGVVLALLALGTSPSVAPQPPAAQQDLAAAQAIYPALSGEGSGSAPAPLTLDSGQLAGLAAMARQASGIERMTIDIEGSGVVARASDPLPAGLWLNISARLDGAQAAEPGLTCAAGQLRIPGMVCGWLWSGLRHMPGWDGAGLPPLDRLVRRLSAGDGRLRLRLERADIASQLPRLQAAPVDFELARDTYCRLALGQANRPAATLDALLRRAFLPGVMSWDARHNRATLVAIAVLVAGKPAFVLLPGAEAIVKQCPLPGDPVLLRGAPDPARHWAFSAGLTAAYGAQAARGLGDLRQFGDAGENKRGPSFADLAASRSGIAFATGALAPASARDTAAEFSLISEDELFPPSLLAAPANLRDAGFVTADGGIDAARYADAAGWIDRKLAEMH